MKLITEFTDNNTLNCLVEKTENGEKNYVIEGVFAQTDKRTEMVVFIQKQLWRRQLPNTTKNRFLRTVR